MLKRFLPDQHVSNIYEITPETLKLRGVKGIITDLDNTLVAWDEPHATPELKEWVNRMREAGIQVTIVSNNNERRVRAFCEPMQLPFVSKARKPLTRAFHKAVMEMGLVIDDVVVIGDQLLTDILGGNRLGVHTILVVPVAQSDAWTTRFNRKMERFILGLLRKNGLIHWEE
ncbi:YqeG family HAD IIIA-type phosphatase [Pullulanibacillus sp. KACC 23026]|uniref:YqeG family HAD IIIA-type phosphatase n=1 Tax=Pullulanibacillus sp. KACC 23026 TaxID=3028315 RepID=UPI0023AFDA77|nr:YqeG family HAD IIIA-type phosphatase [Pullulanibacillus sp. KACC 23026]WEG14200.1 YqeG family HAD IIIA-type phosphatase [Pullulanibacillus sp. KACC 23026]